MILITGKQGSGKTTALKEIRKTILNSRFIEKSDIDNIKSPGIYLVDGIPNWETVYWILRRERALMACFVCAGNVEGTTPDELKDLIQRRVL